MSIDYNKSQFELFPSSSRSATRSEKRKMFWPHLTLSMDNIVILTIVVIMAMVVSFSIGVEKGKKFVFPSSAEKVTPKKAKINRVGQPPVVDRASQSARVETPSSDVQQVMGDLANEPQPIVIEELAQDFPPPQGVYTVQVASFKGEKKAREEASALEKKGYEIYVLPKGNYSIVCVGNFRQKAQAQLFSKELKKRYKDCLIRRL